MLPEVTVATPLISVALFWFTSQQRRAIYESGYPSVGKFPIKNGKKIRLRPDDL